MDKREKEHAKPAKHGKYTYRMFDQEKHTFEKNPMPFASLKTLRQKEKELIHKEKPKRNKRSYL